jgi:hypothetical protein
MITITEMKERLPNITVKVEKNAFMVGQVSGRKNQFATVTTGRGSFEFSWDAVTRAYNNNHWVTI